MNNSQFAEFLQSIGVNLDDVNQPSKLSQRLLDKTKHLAKVFQKIPEISQLSYRDNLELIAKSFSFKNWYEYEKTLNALKDTKDIHSLQNSNLKNSLYLLINFKDYEGTTAQKMLRLMSFGGGLELAYKPLLTHEIIVEALSKYYGFTSMKDAVNTAIVEVEQKMNAKCYLFSVHNGVGIFEISGDGYDLLLQNDPDIVREENILKFRKENEQLIAQYPDFIAGYLNIATTLRTLEDYYEYGKIIDKGIKKAESLIPKGFKGKVNWHEGDNRSYLYLLCEKMKERSLKADYIAAAKIARKLLRLNKEDIGGARYSLPIFLALDGDYRSANAFFKKHELNNVDGRLFLNESMILFVQGKFTEAIHNLIQSILALPFLLSMFNDNEPPINIKGLVKGIAPDIYQMQIDYLNVIENYPEYSEIVKLISLSPEFKVVLTTCNLDYEVIIKSKNLSIFGAHTIFEDFYKKYESISFELSQKLAAEVDWERFKNFSII